MAIVVTADGCTHYHRGPDARAEAVAGLLDGERVVAFDLRRVFPDGGAPSDVLDLHVLWDGQLTHVANSRLEDEGLAALFDLDARVTACMRAAETVGMDPADPRVAPPRLTEKFLAKRCEMMLALVAGMTDAELDLLHERMPWLLALRRVELNRVGIDLGALVTFSEDAALGIHERRFVAHTAELLEGTSVGVRFNVHAAKTGRLHPERGSWNFAGIPRSRVRGMIVPASGSGLVSVDANASDYRCIMGLCGNLVLADLYENATDFHARTAEIAGGRGTAAREICKALTYVSIYGGSTDAAAKALGTDDVARLERVRKRVDDIFSPIFDYREMLHREAVKKGCVVAPGGRRIEVTKSDSSGKVLALMAQATSAEVQLRTIAAAEPLARIAFTVHDEIVAEETPDRDVGRVIHEAMDDAFRHVARMQGGGTIRRGADYWEATGRK